MSPKAKAIALLALVVVFGVGPHLPDLMLSSGYTIVPPIVKLLSALLAAAGTIVIANVPALKQLAGSDNRNSSGGPGLTLGGTPSVKPPPPASPYRVTDYTPPPFARRPLRAYMPTVYSAGSLALACFITLGSFVGGYACSPAVDSAVTTNLTPPAQCLVAAILSGRVDLSVPGTAVLQLLSLCSGTTATSIVALIEQLTGTDAGLGALPSSTLAQLAAVAVEAKKLPPAFNGNDARAALAKAGK